LIPNWCRQIDITDRRWNVTQKIFIHNGANFASGIGMTRLYLFEKPKTSRAKQLASQWCRGYFSHSRSSEGPKPPFNILAYSRIFYFISVCYFSAHMGLLFLLVFKQNLSSLRGIFWFNKNIETFFSVLMDSKNPYLIGFALAAYLLILCLAFVNPCFCSASPVKLQSI